MEKYRKFADSFTGKNPCLPAYANAKKMSIGQFLTHWIPGIILLIVKLPFLLLSILGLFLYFQIIQKIIIVPSLRRIFDNIIVKINTRILLGLFGFFSLPGNLRLQQNLFKMHGQPIFSNHTSPIDVLYLMAMMNPVFVRMNYQADQQKVQFEKFQFLDILKLIFKRDYIVSQNEINEKSQPLEKIMASATKNSEGPVLIFYEGCNNNGQGVLKCPQILLQQILDNSQNIKGQQFVALNIQYKRKDQFSPINTVRNQFWHLVLLLSTFSNSVKILAKFIQIPGNLKIKELEQSFEGFYKGCGQSVLDLDFNNYVKFLEFWFISSSKNSKYVKEVKTEKVGQRYVQ